MSKTGIVQAPWNGGAAAPAGNAEMGALWGEAGATVVGPDGSVIPVASMPEVYAVAVAGAMGFKPLMVELPDGWAVGDTVFMSRDGFLSDAAKQALAGSDQTLFFKYMAAYGIYKQWVKEAAKAVAKAEAEVDGVFPFAAMQASELEAILAEAEKLELVPVTTSEAAVEADPVEFTGLPETPVAGEAQSVEQLLAKELMGEAASSVVTEMEGPVIRRRASSPAYKLEGATPVMEFDDSDGLTACRHYPDNVEMLARFDGDGWFVTFQGYSVHTPPYKGTGRRPTPSRFYEVSAAYKLEYESVLKAAEVGLVKYISTHYPDRIGMISFNLRLVQRYEQDGKMHIAGVWECEPYSARVLFNNG